MAKRFKVPVIWGDGKENIFQLFDFAHVQKVIHKKHFFAKWLWACVNNAGEILSLILVFIGMAVGFVLAVTIGLIPGLIYALCDRQNPMALFVVIPRVLGIVFGFVGYCLGAFLGGLFGLIFSPFVGFGYVVFDSGSPKELKIRIPKPINTQENQQEMDAETVLKKEQKIEYEEVDDPCFLIDEPGADYYAEGDEKTGELAPAVLSGRGLAGGMVFVKNNNSQNTQGKWMISYPLGRFNHQNIGSPLYACECEGSEFNKESVPKVNFIFLNFLAEAIFDVSLAACEKQARTKLLLFNTGMFREYLISEYLVEFKYEYEKENEKENISISGLAHGNFSTEDKSYDPKNGKFLPVITSVLFVKGSQPSSGFNQPEDGNMSVAEFKRAFRQWFCDKYGSNVPKAGEDQEIPNWNDSGNQDQKDAYDQALGRRFHKVVENYEQELRQRKAEKLKQAANR